MKWIEKKFKSNGYVVIVSGRSMGLTSFVEIQGKSMFSIGKNIKAVTQDIIDSFTREA